MKPTAIGSMLALAALLTACLVASPASARGGHSSGHTSSRSSHAPASSYHAPRQSQRAAGVPRDDRGRIKRDPQAKRDFQKSNPCPSTGKASGKCPGFVVDHVQALKRGGADAPSNMQWQSKEAAKAKDKVE